MMTREQNIFLAKKTFVELVYNTAYIEGCNVTFPQTQTIIDGAMVNGVTVDDIQTVLNLRDAWRFCIETVDAELTLGYICKINEYISRNESLQWGVLRNGRVGVGDFIPSVPEKENVLKELERIGSIKEPVERALDYFAYGCKQQLFWDGNKRTSTIVASKILIEAGEGILTIGKENAEEFNTVLYNWYLKDELQPLKDCLGKCIRTLEL
ncbi:MAG: death-on-curing protein [Lachnospiraceae bacterium]|jgi:Fic family protein|nr:death-on-curing protein [Lachnospiraceae bacterium]